MTEHEVEVEVMEQEVEVMELAVMYCCPSKRKAFVAFAVGEDSLSHCRHRENSLPLASPTGR